MTNENIALQAWRKDISYILHAVQGESDSRTFNFILYDQTGTVISPTDKTVSFYVQKPDGTTVMLATTTSGSTISVDAHFTDLCSSWNNALLATAGR